MSTHGDEEIEMLNSPRVTISSRLGLSGSLKPSQSTALRRRTMTDLATIDIEERATPHKYLFRRPRALQVAYQGRLVAGGDGGKYHIDQIASEQASRTVSHQSGNFDEPDSEERSTDFVQLQRDRLDIFIDLLFIGMVSNISEHYYDQCFVETQSTSDAVAEFVLLMAPAWRLWTALHVFLSSYYMDDLSQRAIILVVLALGLVWGNSAPYILSLNDDNNSDSTATGRAVLSYLVAVYSLRLFEIFYSIWLPWLRRYVLVTFFLSIPGIVLWTLVSYATGTTRVYVLIGPIAYSYLESIFVESPIGQRLMGRGLTKTHDVRYVAKRYEGFFTIALGEGVFLLIRDSPLGEGFSVQLGRGVLALMIYYPLHWLYFNGDQSRTFVAAVQRRWYIRELWKFLHVPLCSAAILLSSAILYLIDYTSKGESNGVPGQEIAATATPAKLQIAQATTGASIGIVLFSQVVLALLNRNLDKPGTLLINSRLVRLLPRLLNTIAAVVIGAVAHIPDPTMFLGLQAAMLLVVMLWEWIVGMERGGGVFEPAMFLNRPC